MASDGWATIRVPVALRSRLERLLERRDTAHAGPRERQKRIHGAWTYADLINALCEEKEAHYARADKARAGRKGKRAKGQAETEAPF